MILGYMKKVSAVAGLFSYVVIFRQQYLLGLY